MIVERMTCPHCGGTISVEEDLAQLSCAFCSSMLYVQRGEGYATLKMAARELRQPEASTMSGMSMLQTALQPEAASNVAGIALPWLTPVPEKQPWYRSTGWLVILFIFLTPVWTGIILWDKKHTTLTKVLASIVLCIYVIGVVSSLSGK